MPILHAKLPIGRGRNLFGTLDSFDNEIDKKASIEQNISVNVLLFFSVKGKSELVEEESHHKIGKGLRRVNGYNLPIIRSFVSL